MAKWLNKKRQAIKEMSNKETKHTELEPGFHKLEAVRFPGTAILVAVFIVEK